MMRCGSQVFNVTSLIMGRLFSDFAMLICVLLPFDSIRMHFAAITLYLVLSKWKFLSFLPVNHSHEQRDFVMKWTSQPFLYLTNRTLVAAGSRIPQTCLSRTIEDFYIFEWHRIASSFAFLH